MDIVAHKGGIVYYYDPYIPQVHSHDGSAWTSVGLTAETLSGADLVVLTTDHSAFDGTFIQQHAKLIVDLRNMVKEADENVYKL